MMLLIYVVFYQLPVFVIQFESVGSWPDHAAAFVRHLVTIRHDHLRVISVYILAQLFPALEDIKVQTFFQVRRGLQDAPCGLGNSGQCNVCYVVGMQLIGVGFRP